MLFIHKKKCMMNETEKWKDLGDWSLKEKNFSVKKVVRVQKSLVLRVDFLKLVGLSRKRGISSNLFNFFL